MVGCTGVCHVHSHMKSPTAALEEALRRTDERGERAQYKAAGGRE